MPPLYAGGNMLIRSTFPIRSPFSPVIVEIWRMIKAGRRGRPVLWERGCCLLCAGRRGWIELTSPLTREAPWPRGHAGSHGCRPHRDPLPLPPGQGSSGAPLVSAKTGAEGLPSLVLQPCTPVFPSGERGQLLSVDFKCSLSEITDFFFWQGLCRFLSKLLVLAGQRCSLAARCWAPSVKRRIQLSKWVLPQSGWPFSSQLWNRRESVKCYLVCYRSFIWLYFRLK